MIEWFFVSSCNLLNFFILFNLRFLKILSFHLFLFLKNILNMHLKIRIRLFLNLIWIWLFKSSHINDKTYLLVNNHSISIVKPVHDIGHLNILIILMSIKQLLLPLLF